MIRFYSADIASALQLSEEDSKHCAKVLRHRAGDVIEVVDGQGTLYHCEITDSNPRATKVKIVDSLKPGKPWSGFLSVAVAPTKNPDRMEWLVEKLTEMGVDEIILMRCDRSERKELKLSRLERILVSAMKQSLKAQLPRLMEMASFNEVLEYLLPRQQKFIAYCDESVGKSHLCKEIKPDRSAAFLIGPEGDFTPEEVNKAIEAGFLPVTLGDCRLRTETAAMMTAAMYHTVNALN